MKSPQSSPYANPLHEYLTLETDVQPLGRHDLEPVEVQYLKYEHGYRSLGATALSFHDWHLNLSEIAVITEFGEQFEPRLVRENPQPHHRRQRQRPTPTSEHFSKLLDAGKGPEGTFPYINQIFLKHMIQGYLHPRPIETKTQRRNRLSSEAGTNGSELYRERCNQLNRRAVVYLNGILQNEPKPLFALFMDYPRDSKRIGRLLGFKLEGDEQYSWPVPVFKGDRGTVGRVPKESSVITLLRKSKYPAKGRQ